MTLGPDPKYKIETYTGAVLDHTITQNCISYRFKNSLTGQLGNFSFTLPGMIGNAKAFDDITGFDLARFYSGYGSVSATPLFVGRIENIQNVWDQDGYVRVFTGHDLAEASRRFINFEWGAGGDTAHNAVVQYATDCGFGTGSIAADATAVDVVSHHDKYDGLLQDICDYGTSINKDWYVDASNNLIWAVRPIRTTGVSTLTVGENSIRSYNLTRSINEVNNRFYVFGASEPTVPETSTCTAPCTFGLDIAPTDLPDDHNTWDETTANWTSDSKSGNDGLASVPAAHCGTNFLRAGVAWGLSDADEWIWARRDISATPVRVKDEARFDWRFEFQSAGHTLQDYYVELEAPNSTNTFRYNVAAANYPGESTWAHFYAMCGPAYEDVSADEKWIRQVGTPNWLSVQAIKFYIEVDTLATHGVNLDLDCIYFSSLRWNDIDSDAGSQGNYGIRDYLLVDDTLRSNTACSDMAAKVKAQTKDMRLQLDVVMPFDGNVLIGDRIPITIANENLSAVDFDVIRVEHSNSQTTGAITAATLVSTERVRGLLKSSRQSAFLMDLADALSTLQTNRTEVR